MAQKKILNYTTDVSAKQTIEEIQRELVKSKANSIRTDYNEAGEISAIYFQIDVDGKRLPFKLPAKVDEAFRVMYGEREQKLIQDYKWRTDYQQHRIDEQLKRWKEQARRTAWRIVYKWLIAQLALIELQQAKPEEIFLPYLMIGENKTLFEKMQNNQFLLPG